MLKKWIGIWLSVWSASQAYAFILLSGPVRARLPVTRDEPTLRFVWDGSAPPITDKASWDWGFEGLDGLDGLGETAASLSDTQAMARLLKYAADQWSSVAGAYLRLQIQTLEVLPESEFSVRVQAAQNKTSVAYAVPHIVGQRMESCHIYVNDQPTSVSELAFTLTHEVGHCVGLGHNHTNATSIMSYARGRGSARLGADDKAGVIYLYPELSSAKEGYPLCAGGPPGGMLGGMLGGALWMMMCGRWAAFLRRKRP